MRPDIAGAQIDHRVRRVEQPRVGVPLIDRRGEPAIGARQAFNRRHGLAACDRDSKFRLIALRSGFTADPTRQIIRLQRVVEPPTRAVPSEPFAPGGDKPEICRMLFGEAQCKCLVRERRRPIVEINSYRRRGRRTVSICRRRRGR